MYLLPTTPDIYTPPSVIFHSTPFYTTLHFFLFAQIIKAISKMEQTFIMIKPDGVQRGLVSLNFHHFVLRFFRFPSVFLIFCCLIWVWHLIKSSIRSEIQLVTVNFDMVFWDNKLLLLNLIVNFQIMKVLMLGWVLILKSFLFNFVGWWDYLQIWEEGFLIERYAPNFKNLVQET